MVSWLLPPRTAICRTPFCRDKSHRKLCRSGVLAIALELHHGPPILHIAAIKTQGNLMRRFNTDLCAVVFSIVIAFAFPPAATAAPKLSEADDAAIKSAIASCKAEAKAKKIGFTSRRAFLRDCVTETIKNNPPKR